MGAAATIPATTSIRLVWPFIELGRQRGYEVREWIMQRLQLTPAQLEDPETRVPQRLIARLLDEAIERGGERDIGLMAARYVDSAHFGIGEYVARTRPTLRAALETTGRYLPLLGDGAGHAIERRGRRVIVRLWFSPELAIHEAAYEFAMAIGVLRARRMTGLPDLAPVSVHFMHARPPSTTRHERLFRCPVHFGADVTHVVLSAEFLEMRLSGADPTLGEWLERQATSMLERLPRGDDVTSRVRTLLGGDIALRTASAGRVAQRLGMSVRTLSRKLEVEGSCYRDLVDEARKQAALRELEDGARSIADIADRLGFASSQSFHRAFKRWTGKTADRIRKEARERKPKAGRRKRRAKPARKARTSAKRR
jgi:AraC-like DNA-binding protein